MEAIFLSCLQAQLLVARVNASEMIDAKQKNELVYEIKQVTKKGCFQDAKAD